MNCFARLLLAGLATASVTGIRAELTCAGHCGDTLPQYTPDGGIGCFCFDTCELFGVCCPEYEVDCPVTLPMPTEPSSTKPATATTTTTATTRRGGARPTQTTTSATTTTTQLVCEGVLDPVWCSLDGCTDAETSWLFKTKCRATCGTCPTTTTTTTTATTVTETTITTSTSSSTTTTTTTTTSSTSSSTTTTATTSTVTTSTTTETSTSTTRTTTSSTSSSTTTATDTTTTTATTTTTCSTDGLQLLGVMELNAVALPALVTNAVAHDIREAVVARVNDLVGQSKVAAAADGCALFTHPQRQLIPSEDEGSSMMDLKLSMTISVFFAPGDVVAPLDVWKAGAAVKNDVDAGTFSVQGTFSTSAVGALGFLPGVVLPTLEFVVYGSLTDDEAACTSRRGLKTLCTTTTTALVLSGGAAGLQFADVIADSITFVPRAVGVFDVSVKFLPGNEDVLLAIRTTLEACGLSITFGSATLAAQPTEWAQQTCGIVTTTEPTTTTTAPTTTAPTSPTVKLVVTEPPVDNLDTATTTSTATATVAGPTSSASTTTSTITSTPAGGSDVCNTIRCPAKCIKICGWDTETDMCVTGGETSVEEILTLGVCDPTDRLVDADVFASGGGASEGDDDDLATANASNVTAETSYSMIFIIVAAILVAVLVGVGLLMMTTREGPSAKKTELPTQSDLSAITQEDLARQVMEDYETAYRSLDTSQVASLTGAGSPNQSEMNAAYGSPPQINIQSPTSYSPTYSPSPIKLASPPLGAQRRAAREASRERPPPLLDVVSKAQANQAASAGPADYSDLRYDDGEGPYTFAQFVEFYGEEEAQEYWDDAEQAKPGAVAKLTSSGAEDHSTPSRTAQNIQNPPNWLHGRLERDEVTELLRGEDGQFENGVFIVRKHANKDPSPGPEAQKDTLVLSCNYNGKVTHHRITHGKASSTKMGGFGINGKEFGAVPSKTFQELIAKFCVEPLPRGWPLLLTRGVEVGEETSSRV